VWGPLADPRVYMGNPTSDCCAARGPEQNIFAKERKGHQRIIFSHRERDRKGLFAIHIAP
jgi:hypothetical protein